MASIDKIKIGNSTYDITTSWSSITDKPSSFTPANHSHTKAEVGLGNVDNTADANKSVKYATTAGSANSVAWTNVSNKPSTFPPDSHNHDGRYLRWNGSSADTNNMGWGTLTSTNGYTVLSHASSSDGGDWGMVNKDGKIFMQLDGYYYQNEGLSRVLDTSDSSSFAAASHTHDDRYYTESEIDSKLNGKANSSHTHDYLPLNGSSAMTGTITLPENSTSLKFRTPSDYETGTFYGTAGNEALTFYTASAQTSFQFINGSKPTASNSWQGITPGLQIKNNKVIINKQLGDGTSSDYNLEVNGSMYASSITTPGILDLKNSANGIKFNSKNHYITNIQAGSTSFSLNNSSGSTATHSVNFNDYSKGNGSWYIVTTVNSSTNYPESIISCVSELTSRYFTIKAKRIASVGGGNPVISIDYIAIKFS